MLNRNQRESLRRRYRPQPVRILFVGESPPASGRFFYLGDSGLYRAMRQAFQTVDRAVDHASFLKIFQNSGCYLVDLCPEPVDDLEPASRRAACKAGEKSLSKAIAELRPATVVTLVRSIEGIVMNAASRAGWHGQMIHVPYPGRWVRLKQRFLETLAPVIAGLTIDDKG